MGFGGGVDGVTGSRGVAQVVFVVGVITAFLTAFYVARMLWLAFGGAYRGQGHPRESDGIILVPLVVLAIGSVGAGVVGSPLVGSDNIGKWISTPLLPSEGAVAVNWGLVAATTLIALLGLGFATALYRQGLPEREYLTRVPPLYTLLEHKYYLDDLYEGVFVRAVTGQLAPATYWFDQRVIDGVVNGAALGTRRRSRRRRCCSPGCRCWSASGCWPASTTAPAGPCSSRSSGRGSPRSAPATTSASTASPCRCWCCRCCSASSAWSIPRGSCRSPATPGRSWRCCWRSRPA